MDLYTWMYLCWWPSKNLDQICVYLIRRWIWKVRLSWVIVDLGAMAMLHFSNLLNWSLNIGYPLVSSLKHLLVGSLTPFVGDTVNYFLSPTGQAEFNLWILPWLLPVHRWPCNNMHYLIFAYRQVNFGLFVCTKPSWWGFQNPVFQFGVNTGSHVWVGKMYEYVQAGELVMKSVKR